MVFTGTHRRLMAWAIVEHRMTSRKQKPASGGTYILLLELSSLITIEIGRIGERTFEAGCYAYVGSALGPGGLAARLHRYTSGPRNNHWHIDYLLEHARVIGALFRADDDRRECNWARWVGEWTPRRIPRFGSSDCRCESHLFFVGNRKKTEEMAQAAGCELKATITIGGR